MPAINISAANFKEEVLSSPVPVLVDFWASWCMPCRMMAPILDQVSEEMVGKIKVVKLNVEEPENNDLAAFYDIRSIPNMKIFRGGEVVKELIGARPKEVLLREIEGL